MIDKVSEQIAKNSEIIRQKLIDMFVKEYRSVKNPQKALRAILSTNYTELILNDLGLQKELNKSLPLYKKVLDKTITQIGNVDNVIVDSLFNVQQSYIFSHVRDVGVQLTQSLSTAVLSNMGVQQIRNLLIDATKGLADYQVNALVNTSVRTYGRTMFANSAKLYAPNARYKYVGPNDGKTRDECSEVLNDPRNEKGFTIDEISTLPVTFSDGGGWNCRHDWEIV